MRTKITIRAELASELADAARRAGAGFKIDSATVITKGLINKRSFARVNVILTGETIKAREFVIKASELLG